MKNCFVYVVADSVGKSPIQQFFAVSDEDARRKLAMSIDKEQIPSTMRDDIVLYRCSEVSFPETYSDVIVGDQLELNFEVSYDDKGHEIVKLLTKGYKKEK